MFDYWSGSKLTSCMELVSVEQGCSAAPPLGSLNPYLEWAKLELHFIKIFVVVKIHPHCVEPQNTPDLDFPNRIKVNFKHRVELRPR